MHHRDHQSIGSQGADELAHVQVAVAVDRKEGHIQAGTLQVLAHVQYGRMLDRRRDDVTPIRTGFDHTLDGHVVAL